MRNEFCEYYTLSCYLYYLYFCCNFSWNIHSQRPSHIQEFSGMHFLWKRNYVNFTDQQNISENVAKYFCDDIFHTSAFVPSSRVHRWLEQSLRKGSHWTRLQITEIHPIHWFQTHSVTLTILLLIRSIKFQQRTRKRN